MKVDQSQIYFPSKKVKDLLVGDVFYMHCPASGHVFMKILDSSRHTKNYILDLDCNEFFEQSEEMNEATVFLVDFVAKVKIMEINNG